MEKKEFIVDPRKTSPEEMAKGAQVAQLIYKLNNTMPFTEEYNTLVKELW